ncbi:hypothetical protein [Zongyangia hominis]|uniref:Uncharacterized protein n=1 Tax=Zongyangia hominis TaxID=2763677 RepID=A0A926EAW6_9FIRM|nr:hypothetical protein [Zongyangia hominis]MBC8570532.1 hypothetical protein [Zongyangia hominis]
MNYFEQLVSLGRFAPKGAAENAHRTEEGGDKRPLPFDAGLPAHSPGDFTVKAAAGDIQVRIKEPSPLRFPTSASPLRQEGRALAEEISDEVMFDALRGSVTLQ